MVHLRIVTDPGRAEHVLELLVGSPSVCNVIHLDGAAQKPHGDVILADVAREDASVIVSDLRELEVPVHGSIAIEHVDTQISEAAERAVKQAAGAPADAVVWEEVESRTSEGVELSASYLTFITLATLIAAVGIFLDSPILIIGAMIVGPEFGPLAGLCVAIVQRRRELAVRSATALLAGFPFAISVTIGVVAIFKATGITPDDFSTSDHELSSLIATPDFFSVFVALCAGVAGMLSLTTAKSGALIGVLVSVTTIPAAANVGVSAIYGGWSALDGSLLQLILNLTSLVAAGTLTLLIQRLIYRRRRVRHLTDPARVEAGLPLGRSRHARRRVTPVD